MIYDFRFTIYAGVGEFCSRRREEAERSYRSSRGNEALSFPAESCSSVRSGIFVARASSKNLKPRRGGIIWEILRRGETRALGDVAPTELCSIGGDVDYKYTAPDGAIYSGQYRRTL